jgi:acetylornithine deacetylase/succinyl-diaminopimelate desuccinylase-like protein
LASMVSPDQKRILIDGIYDRMAPATSEDERHLTSLAKTLDPSVFLQEQGASRFKFAGPTADLMRHFLLEPNVTIDGMAAGYTGSGMKTLLPHEAVAKIDIRLVPNMDPEEVVASVRRHLDTHGFSQVDVHTVSSYPWSKSSIEEPINSALLAAYRDFGFDPQIWPLIPGSAPIHLFTRQLGLQFAVGGLGHGGRQHSPDEYATVAGMRLYEKSAASLIFRFASTAGREV